MERDHPAHPDRPPGPHAELLAVIGSIGTKLLSDQLHDLVDAGLVTHAQLPPGPTAYTLTGDDQALLPALEQTRTWQQHRNLPTAFPPPQSIATLTKE